MNEEQYDVLDNKGNKTGQVLPKSEVHTRELWHASVFVWIYNSKGEVLLQLRSADKKSFPNVWDVSVAGHISAGDDPLTTAVREVKEEIGLDIDPSELNFQSLTSDVVPWLPDKKHPEFCYIYTLERDLKLRDLKIQQSELTDIKLVEIESLINEFKNPETASAYAARTQEVFKTPLENIKAKLSNV